MQQRGTHRFVAIVRLTTGIKNFQRVANAAAWAPSAARLTLVWIIFLRTVAVELVAESIRAINARACLCVHPDERASAFLFRWEFPALFSTLESSITRSRKFLRSHSRTSRKSPPPRRTNKPASGLNLSKTFRYLLDVVRPISRLAALRRQTKICQRPITRVNDFR